MMGVPLCRWCKANTGCGAAPERLPDSPEDSHGRRFISGRDLAGGMVALAVISSFSLAPREEVVIIPFLLGAVLLFIGQVLGLIAAFRNSAFWGLISLFIPLGLWCFLAFH